MAVYIDDMYKHPIGSYRGMQMSHMVADTTKELIDMAKAIGVKVRWLQHAGTANEHFDVCLSMRVKAVKLGAVEIGLREYADYVNKRAAKHGVHWARTSVDIIKPKGWK